MIILGQILTGYLLIGAAVWAIAMIYSIAVMMFTVGHTNLKDKKSTGKILWNDPDHHKTTPHFNMVAGVILQIIAWPYTVWYLLNYTFGWRDGALQRRKDMEKEEATL